MDFKLLAKIVAHPRIATAVEFFITKGGEPHGHDVVVRPTLEESVLKALQLIRSQYPQLAEGDIRVYVQHGS